MEFDLIYLLWLLLAIAALAGVVGIIVLYMTSTPYADLTRVESENYFVEPGKDGEKIKFPSLQDPPSLDLSIIVPAYNEEERLPVMLDEALEYLEERQKNNRSFSYEILVVDDGSKDETTEVALGYSEKFGTAKVRVLTLAKNRGKGGAVRLGMFVARGKSLLFADADGASKFSDIEKLEKELERVNTRTDNMAVVCGSRSHLEEQSIAERTFFRTVLMYGFHMLVYILCVRGVKDTQCGFKLLTREAALLIFSNMHVERWAFDVDLLFLAQHFGMPIGEVCIFWQEIEGSKMIPFWSWAQMGKDLLFIRLRYFLGAWKITDKPKSQ